ncbi:unnamed protein product [Paramecium sonneborni]|uniref:Uncharacterized protein n=1 Tax=Paramecium sonneborni TaxID=65129 RepID=A0A8S1MVU1_9CILI|nr:unnamed protein product [Paramecium sonneborni]
MNNNHKQKTLLLNVQYERIKPFKLKKMLKRRRTYHDCQQNSINKLGKVQQPQVMESLYRKSDYIRFYLQLIENRRDFFPVSLSVERSLIHKQDLYY